MSDLYSQMHKKLDSQISELKESEKLLRKANKELKKGKFHLVVSLVSLWVDQGEKSVQVKGKAGDLDLDSLNKLADDKFKILNNRRDVQAHRHQFFVFDCGLSKNVL